MTQNTLPREPLPSRSSAIERSSGLDNKTRSSSLITGTIPIKLGRVMARARLKDIVRVRKWNGKYSWGKDYG